MDHKALDYAREKAEKLNENFDCNNIYLTTIYEGDFYYKNYNGYGSVAG